MSFLDFLLSIWTAIWPFRFVRSGWQGVVFRRGVAEAQPREQGLVWLWPGFWQYETEPVTLRFIDLPNQTITTQDGAVLGLSANIAYKITDLVLALTQVDDYKDAMAGLAMGHIHTRVSEWDRAAVLNERRKLERSVLDTLGKRAEPWGITVEDVRLTDCAPTRVYRVFS